MTVYYNHVPPTFDKNSDKGSPLLIRLRTILFGRAGSPAQPIKEHPYHSRSFSKDVWSGFRPISALFILLWVLALWWGERAVFHRKVKACSWDRWEHWVIALFIHIHRHYKTPHRVVLLADPQLVDPHTYPGRPWPLSTLTVRYTDLYLRKSFEQLQQTLDPDTVLFLGDLFDGGREWTTHPGASEETESVEKRWRKYGDAFWLKEYYRFSRIFFSTWLRGASDGRRDRKIITSLPGNHDLGLGIGIRPPVRQRFNTYFGSGNRVDFIGNHTFVSLDTVSLSAKGQPNVGAEKALIPHSAEEIWRPTEDFLLDVKSTKRRLIQQQLRLQAGKPEHELHVHEVMDIPPSPPAETMRPGPEIFDIPSIVLTHIPLFRASGTPCGPLRERYPPLDVTSEKDDRNAIRVESGVQYQNVLTPEVSKQVIDNVGDVEHVFSGDDHDYCEIVHRGYTAKSGGIREITVKSMSWAMGVRKPGFVMLSLWNPLNADGNSLKHNHVHPQSSSTAETSATMQTHLCLLPDQLGIFIRYGYLLSLTLGVITIRAFIAATLKPSKALNGNLLPISKFEAAANDTDEGPSHRQFHPEKASSVDKSSHRGLASRSAASSSSSAAAAAAAAANRARSSSPAFNGYALPAGRSRAASLQQRLLASSVVDEEDEERKTYTGGKGSAVPTRGVFVTGLEQAMRDLATIAAVAVPWYFWLLWRS
ncbi:MAG: hypothetical protein Q9191_005928 [Dirinaria sp. TL-2023a]